jgi:hypothetical protein
MKKWIAIIVGLLVALLALLWYALGSLVDRISH